MIDEHGKAVAPKYATGPSKVQGIRSATIDEALVEASEWIVRLIGTFTKSLNRKPLSLFSSVEFGCFNYLLVFVSGLVQFSHYAELAVISYVIPTSRCDIALNASERGLLGGACFMGTICSAHLWGFLADTRGRRCIVIPTLLVSFVLDVCASFAGDFYTLATFRFLTGFL